jgi:hypothetical protein
MRRERALKVVLVVVGLLFCGLVACRRVTITRRLASKLSWPLAAKSCLPRNSIPT